MKTTKKIKVDNIDFIQGTIRYEVYKLFKLGKSAEEIAEELGSTLNSVKWYIYKFRSISGRVLSTPAERAQANVTERFVLEIKQDENQELYLYVKVSEEFENWIKENREVRTTRNLWGQRDDIEHQFYQFRIANNYLDDINTPIIYGGKINFAILRVVGISNGLKFKIDGLLTEVQLKKALRKIVLEYKKFFKTHIENNQINLRAELLEEM